MLNGFYLVWPFILEKSFEHFLQKFSVKGIKRILHKFKKGKVLNSCVEQWPKN